MQKNRRYQRTQNDKSFNSSNSPKQLQQPQEKSGECTVCKRISVCICQRCDDFYCSPECQRKDWQSHRYICLPMPPLVKAYLDPSPSDMDPEIPVLSTPMLNNEKHEKTKHINFPNTQQQNNESYAQEQNMRPRQQSQQPQQQPNNASKNSQVFIGNPPVSPLPANNSHVLITGFRSPNRCYVRSLSTSENEGFMRVAKAVDAYGKKAPKLTKFPSSNSYAITHMESDGIMYRVQILGVANKNIRVLFIDYGNTAVRQLSDLREISEDIVRLQQHAVQVSLKGVENYSRNDELANFLAMFEDSEFIIQYNTEDERNKDVVLRLNQSNNTVNKKISEFASHMKIYDKNNSALSNSSKENGLENLNKKQENQTTNKEIRQPNRDVSRENNSDVSNNAKEVTKVTSTLTEGQRPIMNAPFSTRMLKVNAENIDVLVLDNSCLEEGYFGCIPIDDIKNLAKVQEYLENFKDNNEEYYEPKVNEYCIAKFEDAWYRAKVIAMPKKNLYTVLYIDYTNDSNVESKDIRRYPLDLRLDCTTSLCLIHGLPEDLNSRMVKSLQTQIQLNKPIKITKVKEIDEQIVLVDLPEVIKKL